MPLPSTIKRSFDRDSNSSVVDPMLLESLGRRIRYASLMAPDAIADPSSLTGIVGLAQSSANDQAFQASISEMEGFNDSGKVASELAGMPDDLAYITYHQLPANMRRAVRRQGWAPKDYGEAAAGEDDKPSGLFGSIPGLGGLAQKATGFIGEEIMHPVGSVFSALGRGATQAYRGAVAAGQDGFLNSFDVTEWPARWSEVGNGNTYVLDDDRETLKKDYDLSDPELDTYLQLSQGKLPGEIAEEEGFEVGTQEHIDRVRYLYDLAAQPKGVELIGDPLNGGDGMINNYRVSFGRVWARRGGFQPSSLDNGWGKAVSGSGDIIYALTADPTLVAGKFYKGARVMHAIEEMADASKAVHAAYAARMVEEGGWTVSKSLHLPGAAEPGLRTVELFDQAGAYQGKMAASRLALGQRGNAFNHLLASAIPQTPEGSIAKTKLFQSHPGLLEAWDPILEQSTAMAYKHGKGLDDIDTLENWLASSEGYHLLTGSKFGGRNTAKFMRMPEIGRSTELKLKAKGLLRKAQDWSNDIDAKLQEGIGIGPTKVANEEEVAKGAEAVLQQPGKISHIMRAISPVKPSDATRRLQLSANPLRTAARGLLALPVNPGSRFTQIFTTHVPRGGWLGVWDESGLAEFDRFLQFGRSVGMDDIDLTRYRDDFIGWEIGSAKDGTLIPGAVGQSAARRASVVRTYTTDLLSRFDIDEESDLYRKFVKRADEVYMLNPDGSAKPGLAIALAQTAEAVAIPSFRDLMMVTNRYSVMRSIFGRGGVLNPRLIDAGLTRYWKPSVLLRVGFIGRAAGEELLAYLARYGSAKYLGHTLASGVAKNELYDDIMQEISIGNPTKELVEDLRSRTPDQWNDLVAWGKLKAGDAKYIPQPHEVLTWGQSQALAPMSGVIHSMDAFMQKVVLAPWADNVELAPAWKQAWASRVRQADNFVLRKSIRFAKSNKRRAGTINRALRAAPGLQSTGRMLDQTLSPILSKYMLNYDTFKEVARQGGLPSKQQLAKMLAHLDDEDFLALNEMLTDPAVRRAHLEQVTGGETLALNIEPSTGTPEELKQTALVYNPRTGGTTEQRLVPDGNKQTINERVDGLSNGQRYLDFYNSYQDRLRHIMDPRIGVGEAAIGELANHVTPSMVREMARITEHVPLGEAAGPERIGRFINEIRNLPYHKQKALIDGLENGTMPQVADELAGQVFGEEVEQVLERRTLEALSLVGDRKLQHKLLNPKVDTERMSDNFPGVLEEARVAIKRVFGKPGTQRRLTGWEGYANHLMPQPRVGTIQGYAIAADHNTSLWASQHLTFLDDPKMADAFTVELQGRLAAKKLPDVAEEVSSELFNPEYPANQIFRTFKENGRTDSIPISYLTSPDVDLADAIVDSLATVTGKRFHLQRLDVPEHAMQSKFMEGTGSKILDGQPDWQDSILWRGQMEDFSGSTPLPLGARRYQVEVPDLPVPAYDRPFGPPDPLGEPVMSPTSSRWEPTMDPQGNSITDVVDQLPDVEVGKVRIYGVKPLEVEAGEPTFYLSEPEDFWDDLEETGHDWFFADVTEDTYRQMVGQAEDSLRIDDLEGLRGLDQHHFATDGVEIQAMDQDGEMIVGWHTTPQAFDYTELVPEIGWKPGFSPVHYVGENERTLRRIANFHGPSVDPAAIDGPTAKVLADLGASPEDLVRLVTEGPQNRALRMSISMRAEKMLTEGKTQGLLNQRHWAYEDELEEIATDLGQWGHVEIDALWDDAEAALSGYGDPELDAAWVALRDAQSKADAFTDPNALHIAGTEEYREVDDVLNRQLDQDLRDAQAVFDEAWLRRYRAEGEAMEDSPHALYDKIREARYWGASTTDNAVSARNKVVADLDRLVPGWRGSEGWDRVGTGRIFGIPSHEPTALEGGARKQIGVGLSPGQVDDNMVNDQLENIVRHLTNARAESVNETRVLDEIIGPLAHHPSPSRIDMQLVSEETPIGDLPLATHGQKYVTPRTFAPDRLFNWFFDDAASKGISSIVRNQLFATNYVEAARLNRGMLAKMTDPTLRYAAEQIASKWGVGIDDLDELIRQQRHGMVTLPHHAVEPWDEVVYAGEGDDLEEYLVTHFNELETGVAAQQREAVTAVQNSVLKVPNPDVSVADANRMLRDALGLVDSPEAQAIRAATTQVERDIIAEQGKIANEILNQGGSRQEVNETIAHWRKIKQHDHNLQRANARSKAEAEVAKLRASGEQLMTDPKVAQAYAERLDRHDIRLLEPDDMVTDLTGRELTQLRHYFNQQTNALDTLRDSSMQRALEGTIPFIDDHRVRSQFQEYVGNLVPFWFAEEQFLKRWVRIFKESPDAFRKGQLAMHGLREIGFVQEDMNGNEYYVYPGSAAATSFFSETPVAKILFGSEASLPVGLSMTGDVKHTLPGFGDQMGVPSFGPFVGMSLEMLASRSPEWAAAQESLMGERGSNRQLYSYIVPTTISRFYSAFTNNTSESSLASALIETAQLMEATGHGLAEDATADQEQAYIDQVEANARSVQLMRAFTGFVSPASPGISNAESLPLADEFESLIQSGVPYTEALMMFMEHNEGDVSPYTVFRTEVPSSAPLAATQEALVAMDGYEREMRQFPMAAPWMLLPFRATEDEFDNRAYRQQIRMGLRKYRDHKEYIRALSWADASPEYFDKVDEFDMMIESWRLMGNQDLANQKTQEKRAFTEAFQNSHPLFKDKLNSSEGRIERDQILRESYQLMDHPLVQDNPRVKPMKEMLTRFRDYTDSLYGLNQSRAQAVVQRKEMVTMEFRSWLELHMMAHPELRYFYDRVLRPELRWSKDELDQDDEAEGTF